MTRECDDSRHSADRQQPPSLSWDRVHTEEQYERTSHNFGQRLSAGLSFDLGGARIDIGTGGGHHHRNSYQNESYYGGNNNYSQNYNNYNNYNGGSDYNNYTPNYQGYQGNQSYGYDNSARNIYGQVVGVQDSNTSQEATRYYYEQQRNQQQQYQYQDNYDSSYQQRYNRPVYGNSDDRYVIQVNPGDQYYGPNNNRFDLAYQGGQNGYDNNYENGYNYNSGNGYNSDNGFGQASRYNYQQNWNDRYIIDAPSSNDYYYSNNGNDYGRYQGNRYNRNDYRQSYDDGQQHGYQNRYNQNQYQQYRYPNGRYAESDDGYYGRNGYQNNYDSDNGGDWMRMRSTLQSMLGRSPREFNRNVPEDLGCATVVSAALRQAYGENIRDTSVNGLENSLRRNGYEAIPVQYAKPGDCIIAHRAGNRHGHAAIYVGDGKVVNNSSAQGRVVVAPLNNFASRDYQSVVAYRKV